MDNKYAWFFDVFAVAIILFYLYSGGKRGFVKSLLYFVGYIVAFIAAVFVSNTVSPVIYDNAIKERVITSVEEKLDGTDVTGEITRMINNYFGKYGVTLTTDQIQEVIDSDSNSFSENLSDKINSTYREAYTEPSQIDSILGDIFDSKLIKDILPTFSGVLPETINEYFKSSNMTLNEILGLLSGDKRNAAEFIEQNVIRHNILVPIKAILFILTFFVAMAIVRFATRMMSFVDKIPLIGPANTLLGMVVGIIEGLLVVYIVAMIIRLVITLSSGEMIVFNNETIETTKIFKHIYNYNILSL